MVREPQSSITRRGFLAAAVPLPHRTILVHEHVLVDFTGNGRWDPDEVFRAAKPKLDELRAHRCERLQECTPNFLGRDPKLLRRLADATGIELWTNTGLYAAADYKFLPPFAREESAEKLARRWITEARGVDGVKLRFIKIGVNRGPLPQLDRKLAEAAAICSAETGLTIASHTGNGVAAEEQLAIVTRRVPAGKFVWVHAQSERDPAFHERVARAGGWVEFDGVNERSADWHLECVRRMAGAKLLDRVLISQDSGWYRVGEPGGEYRGYTYLFTDFVPRLDAGWSKALLWENPRRAFGR